MWLRVGRRTCEGERGGEDARHLRRVAGVLEHEDELLAAGGVDAGPRRLGARLEVGRRRQGQRLAAGHPRDCGQRRRQRRGHDGGRWLRWWWRGRGRRPRRGRRGRRRWAGDAGRGQGAGRGCVVRVKRLIERRQDARWRPENDTRPAVDYQAFADGQAASPFWPPGPCKTLGVTRQALHLRRATAG